MSFLLTISLYSCHEDGSILVDEELGIGTHLYQEIDNTVAYDWYFDQDQTGTYSEANCGPTCATMVIKWKDEEWNKSVEYFRRSASEDGSWWKTDQLRDTLNKYGAECVKKNFTEETLKSFKTDLKYGNIAILCLDSYYLDENLTDDGHYGRYYHVEESRAGHFIIVKGYKETDTGLWLEVYDPNGLNAKYPNGELKGINRYHHINDIFDATNVWWKYYIKVKR